MEKTGSQSSFIYEAFGLVISSEIEMECLAKTSKKPEVFIRIGKTTENIKHVVMENDIFAHSRNEIRFLVKGVAKFQISNGVNIVVEPLKCSEMDTVILFILGSAFGALLIQRGVIPLHGSAIKYRNECVLILGDSGAGKSTLAASLIEDGGKILSDDVIATRIEEKRCLAVASYPQQKLCSNSMKNDDSSHEKIKYVFSEREKFYVNRKTDFWNKSMDIKKIFLLEIGETDKVEISQIFGSEKLNVLLKNVYRSMFVKYFGKEINQFNFCSSLAKQCECYLIKRPKKILTSTVQMKLIESLIIERRQV